MESLDIYQQDFLKKFRTQSFKGILHQSMFHDLISTHGAKLNSKLHGYYDGLLKQFFKAFCSITTKFIQESLHPCLYEMSNYEGHLLFFCFHSEPSGVKKTPWFNQSTIQHLGKFQIGRALIGRKFQSCQLLKRNIRISCSFYKSSRRNCQISVGIQQMFLK